MPAAAAPAAISAVSGLASTGVGLYQSIQEGNRRKQMEDYLANYQRQELANPMEGLQVSTLGADRQREDLARSLSTVANQAAQGGSRAVASITPQATQQLMDNEAKIMADLDQQYRQNQQLIAQGAAQVQAMQENREQNDLLGIGNAMNVASQNQNSAMTQAAQGLMGLGLMGASGGFNNLFSTSGTQQVASTPMQFGNINTQLKLPQYNGLGSNTNTNPFLQYRPKL